MVEPEYHFKHLILTLYIYSKNHKEEKGTFWIQLNLSLIFLINHKSTNMNFSRHSKDWPLLYVELDKMIAS